MKWKNQKKKKDQIIPISKGPWQNKMKQTQKKFPGSKKEIVKLHHHFIVLQFLLEIKYQINWVYTIKRRNKVLYLKKEISEVPKTRLKDHKIL